MAERKGGGPGKAPSRTNTKKPAAGGTKKTSRTALVKAKPGARPTAAKAAPQAKKATTKKAAPTAQPKRGPAKGAAATRTAALRRPAGKSPAPKTRSAPKAAVRKKQAQPAKGQKRSPVRSARQDRDATVPTPPSSLDMNRRGSAARTGRAEMAEERADNANMTPSITGGDVDTDVGNAYFSGDEAPGGDNPTPDQDIVDDIGRALGVEYQDNEELRASDKVAERDKHRWELDPASSEDYRDRDKD